MKRIIGILKPFEFKQQFYVYSDGKKIDKIEFTIDEIPEQIIELAQSYEITQLDLTGPKRYVQGISQKIQENELTKYNKNTLEINLI